MLIISYRENGETSNIERVFLYKDSGATAGTEGDPITGLTNSSTGLNISTIANNEATANTDTSAATSSIETIATLGTYATPTAGFVRFREVDATNLPGLYELQWEDARYAVSGASWLDVAISGVADLAPFHGRIYLKAIPSNVTEFAGGAIPTPAVTGVPDVNTTHVSDTAQTANDNGADINAILTDTAEIGTAGAGLTNLGGSGNNWNVGKTGYSLTPTTGLGNQTANITGNLSGSVGSVTGAVGSVTGNVGGVAGTIQTLDALDTAQDTQHATTQGKVDTAQADLDIITGTDGVTLATAQALYAPSKAGDAMSLSAGAITNASLAGNMEIVFETDFSVNYNATRNAWVTNTQDTVGTGSFDTATGFSTLSAAQVNAEVVDALATDTYAEPGSGAIAATNTLAAKINYLFKWVRNKKDNDGATTNYYADDGTTIDHTQTTTESGGTVTKGEMT